MDVGARHLLFACGDVIGKLPWGSSHSCEREVLALQNLPHDVGPSILGEFAIRELRHHQLEQFNLPALLALDLPLGNGFLMKRWRGEHLNEPVSDSSLLQVGELLTRLHHPIQAELPRLQAPSQATTMLRIAEEHFSEIRKRRLLDKSGGKALQQAIRQARKLVERWRKLRLPRVRTLCHGDLRWHNLMAVDGNVRLLDFEHSGMGDPAVDVAMMVCRTPLHSFYELRLLDAYVTYSKDASFLDRYFLLKPLVGFLCSLGAMLYQVDVAEGRIGLGVEGSWHTEQRMPAIVEELQDALRRFHIEVESQDLEPILMPPQRKQPKKGWVTIDGTSSSLKSPIASAFSQASSLPYFNTGLMYRYASLWAYCHELEPSNPAHALRLCEHLTNSDIQLTPAGKLKVNESIVEECLSLPVVEEHVATWSSLPSVRATINIVFEACFSEYEGGVVEGRDAGTHLLPDAVLKVYVDAPLTTRAALLAERTGCSEKEAKGLLQRRDQQDQEREVAPLKMADDAIQIQLQPRTFHRELKSLLKLWEEKGSR